MLETLEYIFTNHFTGVVIFLIVCIGYFGFFIVRQQNVSVIERFGKFLRVASPGFNFLIPFIDTVAGSVNLRVQQLDVNVETKTKDNVFVKLVVSVQYQVVQNKIFEAFYKLAAPAYQMQAYVFDVVRAKVPSLILDDVFEKKDDIAIDVKNELKEIMEDFGYEIIKALVTDIDPDINVKHAMNEINTSQRLRIAAQEKGEAEKIIKIKQAEADAESNILQGKGIAGQRAAIIDGLSQSIEELKKTSPNLESSDIMSTILAIQYFDTLKDISASSNSNTLFVPNSAEHASHVRNSLMEALFATQNSKK